MGSVLPIAKKNSAALNLTGNERRAVMKAHKQDAKARGMEPDMKDYNRVLETEGLAKKEGRKSRYGIDYNSVSSLGESTKLGG